MEKDAPGNAEYFQALARISRMSERSVNEICDFALEEAVKLTQSDIGYIYFYSEQSNKFTLYSWSKSVMDQCSITNPQMIYPLEHTGLWGEAVRQRRPIMVNDYHSANPLKRGCPEGHAPLHRFLTLPVFDKNEIVAVIGVGNKKDAYNDAETHQLQLFMDSVWRLIAHRSMEEQLRLTRDAAEAANRSKSEFLAQLSHEIRTSMNGVYGMAELLHTTNLDEQQLEYLHILQASADGLLLLLNDTLDLARIESGKLSLCMAEFSVATVLHEVAESQRYMLGLKDLHLRLDLDAAIPERLVGDALRMKQILLNLLINAIKFTEHGQITVRSRLLGQTKENILVKITVADTGIGMSENTLRQVFSPFEQATAETAGRFGGSGLGLAICKQLTELHGGEIEVESELGKGSAFHVTLPFTAAAAATPLAAGRIDVQGADAVAPCRILVAEDNEMIRNLLCTLLAHMGHQSVSCGDGRSALEQLQHHRFDLILMDIRMPIMDGLQALRHLRAWEKRSGGRQPVVALTAHAMAGDRKRFLAAGFDGYLAKPIKMQEFTRMLQEMLAPGRTEEETAEEHRLAKTGP
jgi:signal transduction histidine kinase/AmiR/NasT family two-component response regulator